MKKLALLAVLACGFGPGERSRFVVHEWGTFTTVSGADGAPMSWRPLLGPDDLPRFVYRMNSRTDGGLDIGKAQLSALVRMETPVIYFYSDVDVEASVKVGFPQGKVTEWYPQATDVKKGVEWAQVRVRPGSKAPFPREARESHYYPARETDAAPVAVAAAGGKTEHEKLLFYRGLGWFQPPVRASVKGLQVKVEGVGTPAPAEAIVFERKGSAVGWRRAKLVAGVATVARPEPTGSVESLERELEGMLADSGLYGKEAAAMVKTWRDTWFEDGLRVFYLLPTAWTEKILPLTVTPKPTEIVRTMICRVEILAPEREQSVLAQVRLLKHESADVRTRARAELKKHGRFLEPTLWRLVAASANAEEKKQLGELIAKGV